MRAIENPILTALGTCTICLLFLVASFVSPSHVFIYHLSISPVAMFASVGIDFCLMWIALAALMFLGRRIRWLDAAIWSALIAVLPWVAAKNVVMLMLWPFPRWFSFLLAVVPIVMLAGLLFLPWPMSVRAFLRVRGALAVLLGLAALPGALLLAEMPWFAWKARALNAPPPAAQVMPAAHNLGERPRVLWILLDELSYQQIYERRFPGIGLPAFDELAAQSTVFTHTIPAGFFTELVVPALITGSRVDELRISADGQLRALRDSESEVWMPFDPKRTVFQDAKSAGYDTGIAGWYNPYCRILSTVVDSCYWTFRPGTVSYLDDREASAKGMPRPLYLLQYLAGWLHLPHSTPPAKVFAQRQIDDYKDLLRAGDTLLEDRSYNFSFLHLPIPHPHGFFDRKRMAMTTDGTSYIDNLVLADQYLAHVHDELEKQGEWDSTAVIVMGDHSWRTSIWSFLPLWKAEEEDASRGAQFDDRPGYMIKMPNQQKMIRVDTPYKAIRTRALLDAVMEKKLLTGEDVARWARQ